MQPRILADALANLAAQAGRIRQLHYSLRRLSEPAGENNAIIANYMGKWRPQSVRVGLIARKRGMVTMWDDHGAQFPVTVLQVDQCEVTANVETVRKDKTVYHAVQVAAHNVNRKAVTKAMAGHFNKAGVKPKRMVKEFPVTQDAHVPVGTKLSAVHFVPGQYVDVIAKSIGKGFAGVMKRWGFKGQGASHGVSLTHRSAGATGQHQDPGRVFPGKKMPGRLGGERTTAQNLEVVRVDTSLDLIYVRGCVPGVDDAFVMIRDAKKKMAIGLHSWEKGFEEKRLPKNVDDLPFPAGTKQLAKALPAVIVGKTKRVASPFAAK